MLIPSGACAQPSCGTNGPRCFRRSTRHSNRIKQANRGASLLSVTSWDCHSSFIGENTTKCLHRVGTGGGVAGAVDVYQPRYEHGE
eukprot:scaffold45752_cov35-Tisochrysis_lutea.AAC.1